MGKIKIDDRVLPGLLRSGQRDIWSHVAQDRIRALGIEAPRFLALHIELRAAAMVVVGGATTAEVFIGNAPCGYRTPPPGCHQVLERFLPEGAQLTVSGTDSEGRPYRRTYPGRARR